MKKAKPLFKQIHELHLKNTLVINQLNEWIKYCDKKSADFKNENMQGSELSSIAMSTAYNNVLNLIKINNQ